MHIEHYSSSTFSMSQNAGCLRLYFRLPAICDSGELIFKNILSTNNSRKIPQNWKSLLGMSIETRISCFIKNVSKKNLVRLSLQYSLIKQDFTYTVVNVTCNIIQLCLYCSDYCQKR
jgi:hypothetical protein